MVQNPRAEPVYQLLNRSIACRSSVEGSVGTHEGLSLLQKGGGGIFRAILSGVSFFG